MRPTAQRQIDSDLESDALRARRALNAMLGTNASPNGPGMKVLLVEDDFADTQLIQRALQRHPHVSEVVARNSPARTLMELSSGRIRPALIFLDISMPGMNGFQFLEGLRKIRTMDETPVVFLTSSAFVTDVGRAIRSSARDYIVKPDTFEELETKLDVAIRRVGPV
jgi:DNA-binding response OmpR family regulator